MHRCHAAPDQWGHDGRVRLSERESHHLTAVMRLTPGAAVGVFDGIGRTAQARVETVGPDGVVLTLTGDVRQDPVLESQVTLVQALPKGGRMDDIVTKCTEIGVACVMPVISERCIVRMTPEQAIKRHARWERVAVSAAKQCGTPVLPAIAPVSRLSDMTPDLFDACLVATLAPDLVPLHTAVEDLVGMRPARVAIVIGPEGDLTPDETDRLLAGGATGVTFGPHTLRTDTAAIYAVSVLTYAIRAAASRAGS